MVHAIRGTVVESVDQKLILDTAMGLSLALQMPVLPPVTLGQQTTVYAYLHWNQEQGPSLFGFCTLAERDLFLLLIDCSGIGPKMAVGLLGQMRPAQLVTAVQAGDVKLLSSLHGIGAKKAEQLVVQLKHKVATLIEQGILAEETGMAKHLGSVTQVLTSLNYSRTEISQALDALRADSLPADVAFDVVLRKSLSFLAKRVSI